MEACRLRIRPILMTSLATIMGLTPMAFGIGEGSEMNVSLARAVIGGLLVSVTMALLFTPVLYMAIHRRSATGPTTARPSHEPEELVLKPARQPDA